MGKGFDSESAFFIRWLTYSSKGFQKEVGWAYAYESMCLGVQMETQSSTIQTGMLFTCEDAVDFLIFSRQTMLHSIGLF